LVCYLGAENNLGNIFMRLCKNQESKFDVLPILRNKEFFQDSLFSGLQDKLALENDESFPENDFNKFLDQR
jgi:hypothetical protein